MLEDFQKGNLYSTISNLNQFTIFADKDKYALIRGCALNALFQYFQSKNNEAVLQQLNIPVEYSEPEGALTVKLSTPRIDETRIDQYLPHLLKYLLEVFLENADKPPSQYKTDRAMNQLLGIDKTDFFQDERPIRLIPEAGKYMLIFENTYNNTRKIILTKKQLLEIIKRMPEQKLDFLTRDSERYSAATGLAKLGKFARPTAESEPEQGTDKSKKTPPRTGPGKR